VLLPAEPAGQAEAQSLLGHMPFVQIAGDPAPVQVIQDIVAGAEAGVVERVAKAGVGQTGGKVEQRTIGCKADAGAQAGLPAEFTAAVETEDRTGCSGWTPRNSVRARTRRHQAALPVSRRHDRPSGPSPGQGRPRAPEAQASDA
jgi:hypothetical protein